MMARRSLHRVSHGRDISVETDPGILNVEHQRIKTGKLRIRWPQSISVQAINRQSRCRVPRRRDAFIHRSADPVFRAEQRHQLHARRVREQINRAASLAVNPRLIGDQPHALASQRREVLRLKHINPRQGLGWRGGKNRNLEPRMHTDKHG